MAAPAQKDYLDAVVRTAQYLAGLTDDSDIWAQLANVATHFFDADWVAFVGRRPEGPLFLRHASLSDENDRAALLAETRATLVQVLDSGFLASELVSLPSARYATAFLPLSRDSRTVTVMLVGHRADTPLPRQTLNIYLAVAGLFETTLTRITSQHRFLSMADNVPEMLYQMVRYADGTSRFFFVSKGSQAVLGIPPDELMSDSARFRAGIHEQDRDAFEAALLSSAQEGTSLHLAFRWHDGERDTRYLLLNAMPRRQGDDTVIWDGALQDITERERLAEESRRTLLQLGKTLEETVQAIAATVDMRDPYTAGHQRRVAELATEIARALALPEEEIHGIRLAATIHDIGKIHVPAEILSYPGKLGDIEYALIKTHPKVGYEILKNVEFPWPVAEMVFQHHEHLDGSGYPQGLRGEDILLGARILCVADVVEAIASYRPYRPGRGLDEALAEITRNRDRLYDGKVVDACLRVLAEKGYFFEHK